MLFIGHIQGKPGFCWSLDVWFSFQINSRHRRFARQCSESSVFCYVFIAYVAGVRKERGRELGREIAREEIPPSPFNACHAGEEEKKLLIHNHVTSKGVKTFTPSPQKLSRIFSTKDFLCFLMSSLIFKLFFSNEMFHVVFYLVALWFISWI